VFPGQTFDVPIPLAVARDAVSMAAITDAVEEFHRRNSEARLIESRAEEPLVRGLRLLAVGRSEHPDLHPSATPDTVLRRSRRAVHVDGAWTDAAVVDVAELAADSIEVEGPAVVELPFSSLLLRAGDVARTTPAGDVLVDIAGSE